MSTARARVESEKFRNLLCPWITAMVFHYNSKCVRGCCESKEIRLDLKKNDLKILDEVAKGRKFDNYARLFKNSRFFTYDYFFKELKASYIEEITVEN